MPLTIIRGDLSTFHADALVNAANEALQRGGGVCGALFEAAGANELQEACDKIGRCPPGGAVITPAFRLNAKHVIHTVGPIWRGGGHGERETLVSSYTSALRLAAERGLSSIAFPLISAGIYGYPRAEALEVATGAIRAFLQRQEDELDVTLVLYDRKDLELSGRLRAELDHLLAHVGPERADEISQAFGRPAPDVPERPRGRFRAKKNAAEVELFGKTESARETRDPEVYLHSLEPDGLSLDAPAPPPVRQKTVTAPGKAAPGAPDLNKLISHADEGFSTTLLKLIDSKHMKDPEVYKRANLDRKHFSKIRSNPAYVPTKPTVLALAIALRLDRPQTQSLLARAGFALSPAHPTDIIVGYYIDRAWYDIDELNQTLLFYEQGSLGASG